MCDLEGGDNVGNMEGQQQPIELDNDRYEKMVCFLLLYEPCPLGTCPAFTFIVGKEKELSLSLAFPY